MSAKTPPKNAPANRRPAAGHLDPKIEADVRARAKQKGLEAERDRAFTGNHPKDSLAEQLGSQFVEMATSGEDEGQDVMDELVPEEEGGPFIETSGKSEFAKGTDASNPKGAKREPFPKV